MLLGLILELPSCPSQCCQGLSALSADIILLERFLHRNQPRPCYPVLFAILVPVAFQHLHFLLEISHDLRIKFLQQLPSITVLNFPVKNLLVYCLVVLQLVILPIWLLLRCPHRLSCSWKFVGNSFQCSICLSGCICLLTQRRTLVQFLPHVTCWAVVKSLYNSISKFLSFNSILRKSSFAAICLTTVIV